MRFSFFLLFFFFQNNHKNLDPSKMDPDILGVFEKENKPSYGSTCIKTTYLHDVGLSETYCN